MQPDRHEFDDEIRGHMALSVRERIDCGEDPEAARLAALKEFGNVTLTRDSMRGVWRPDWLDAAEALGRDIRFALRRSQAPRGRTRSSFWRPPMRRGGIASRKTSSPG